MIGFVIPCSYENRNNILRISKFFSNKRNILLCLIVNNRLKKFLEIKKINNKNTKLIINETKNVSHKRNLGINFFLRKNKIKWISFFDSDCTIDIENFTKIKNFLEINNFDIVFVNLLSPKGNKIGNTLNNLPLLNFINIYRAGTPSVIIKKIFIKKLFDTKFGIGTPNYSAEDTKFLIDNFTFNVFVIKNAYIFHPNQNKDIIKISKYSYGQKQLIRNIKITHSVIFFMIIFFKPLFGLLFNFIKLDIYHIKIYSKRIKILLYG